jgi:hypothetical protein
MNPRGQLMRQGSNVMLFTLLETSFTTFDYSMATIIIIIRPEQKESTGRASHENGQGQGNDWYRSLIAAHYSFLKPFLAICSGSPTNIKEEPCDTNQAGKSSHTIHGVRSLSFIV